MTCHACVGIRREGDIGGLKNTETLRSSLILRLAGLYYLPPESYFDPKNRQNDCPRKLYFDEYDRSLDS